ncbi:MAG: 4-demethylwyosine synthase TYW1 [Candidatus Aenigmarchaeota archaeon]|nr:4-demethylwyosine synthase TYW1 [Candidatus Aenigmarchaeota archaeon]
MQSNVIFNQNSAKSYRERMMEKMEKAGYRFVGKRKHSAVKICSWCKSSLNEKGHCYKQKFYGIESSQCIQMSPTALVCSENCLFCWRPLRYTMPGQGDEWDEPSEILDGCIEAQRDLLQGFGGNPNTDNKKFYYAMRPKHVAISLSGEPTLYPKIGSLVEEIIKRKMTAFLVTNGTLPERLQSLLDNDQQPTQLYITLAAPDNETLRKTALPMFDDAWERLMASLAMLEQFKRSVIRLTLVKNLNLVSPEGYAEIVDKASPDYLEVKAFMSVGGARERLAYELMPSDSEILDFAENIERNSSYKIIDHKEDSRVVLMTRDGKPKEFLPGDD